MADKELQVLWGIFELSQVRTSFQIWDWIKPSFLVIIISYLIYISEAALHMHYINWYYIEENIDIFVKFIVKFRTVLWMDW